jgi:hypothetical protein
MYLGDVRCILEPGSDGNLVTSKTKTLDATAPVDYTYSSANPYKERAFEWQELYGGFGQGTAPPGGQVPRRYSHTVKADLSVDGLWMKGPKFETHEEALSGAGEIRQMIWALHSGSPALFAICQNGVYRRVADNNWAVSLSAATLGGGVFPQQAMRFKHRGATPLDALYVATNASNLWQYNGTTNTWALAGTTAGPGTGSTQGEARYIERVNDELWVAGNYWVVKVTDDPMDRTKYSAVIYIGDQTAKITWLKQLNDTLIIYKEDGVYTVDTTGLDHELFPTLRGANHPNNGKNAAVWINRIWFTFGDQTFTIDEQGTLKPDGTEQLLENTSDVHGQWVAGAGHNTWFFYEMYYNLDNNMTYLIKHGTWVEENSSQATPGVAQFAEAHHGALYDWNKQGCFLDVVSGAASTGNDRIYVGFTDGTIQWAVLPQNSPNPAEDVHCEFTSLDSYVYLPTHHSGFRADNKLWHAITATGPHLTNTEWIEVEYRLDISNDLSEWVPVTDDGVKFTIPSQRKTFTDDEVNDPVSGKLIQFRAKLVKDPSLSESPPFLSPVSEGIIIHESIRPAFSREFTFSIKAASFLPRRDGMADRRRGEDIRQRVLQRCAQVGPLNVLMPTGEYEPLTIVDYRDSGASWSKRRDHEYLIQIQGIQLGVLSVETPGVSSGLTYDTLEQYTLDELEAII